MIKETNKKIFFLILLFITSNFLSSIIIPFILNTLSLNDYSFYLKTFIGQTFAFVLPTLLFLVVSKQVKKVCFEKKPLFDLTEINKKNKNDYKMIILIPLFYLMIHFAYETLISAYIYFFNDYSIITRVSNLPFTKLLITILLFAVIPSFIEEFIYRGLYFDTFKNNKILLFLVTSTIFALSHNDVSSIVITFLLGLFLMYIMNKTGNIRLLIISHFIYNLLAIIFSNYIELPFSSNHFYLQLTSTKIIFGSIFINLALSILFALIFLIYKNKLPMSSKKTKTMEKYSGKTILLIILLLICSTLSVLLRLK